MRRKSKNGFIPSSLLNVLPSSVSHSLHKYAFSWNDFLLCGMGRTKDSFCLSIYLVQVKLLINYKFLKIQSLNHPNNPTVRDLIKK